MQNLDAKIGFMTENQDDLSSQLDQPTEFHTAANLSIARLSALNENHKK